MTDEALGRLTGMWLAHRWGRIQDNKLGKEMGLRDGYNWNSDNANTPGLWEQGMNTQNNIAQYTRPNAQATFDTPQSQGLFAQALNAKNNIAQYTRPQQESNTEFYNTLQQPFTSGPLQANEGLWQTVLKQKEQQPFAQATQSFNQTTQPLQVNANLRGFTQPQGMWPNPSVTPLSASVNGGGPAKASNTMNFNVVNPMVNNTFEKQMHQQLEEVSKLGIPDRNAIMQNYRYQRGKDVVALVKAGMSPKDAFEFANNRMQENVEGAYKKYANKFTDDVLEPMRQDIINNLMYTTDKDGNTVVDTYNSSKVKGMYGAVMRYNALAQKVGAQGIDINNLASAAAINKPNFKDTFAPNGRLVRVNGDTGEITDLGSYSKTHFTSTNDGIFWKYDDEGKLVPVGQHGGRKMIEMKNGDRYMVGPDGSNDYLGRFLPPQEAKVDKLSLNQRLQSLTSLHNKWMEQHNGSLENESPFYNDLQSALNGTVNQSKSTISETGGQTSLVASEEEEERLRKRIMESYELYGHDATVEMLIAKGLGFYGSWVPNDK